MEIYIIQAFVLVFIAELGDKSQLLAMTLATKYRTRSVVLGLFIGITLNHVLAIGFGSIITQWLSPTIITLVVGSIFLVFGLVTILESPHQTSLKQYQTPAFITIGILFFLGELGDKTQFATMALGMESSTPWFLLIGTVSAMMMTSILAIIIGKRLGKQIPETTMKLVSSSVFVGYGSFRLLQSIPSIPIWIRGLMLLPVLALFGWLIVRYLKQSQQTLSDMKKTAMQLQHYFQHMDDTFNVLCLGESVCGACTKDHCLIGHVKYLIEEGKKGHPVSLSQLRSKAMKRVDSKRLDIALDLTIHELKDHWDNPAYSTLHHIRQAIEYLRFHTMITSTNYVTYQNELHTLQIKKG